MFTTEFNWTFKTTHKLDQFFIKKATEATHLTWSFWWAQICSYMHVMMQMEMSWLSRKAYIIVEARTGKKLWGERRCAPMSINHLLHRLIRHWKEVIALQQCQNRLYGGASAEPWILQTLAANATPQAASQMLRHGGTAHVLLSDMHVA